MTDKTTVLRSVLDAVRIVQDASGRPIDELSEDTNLFTEVEGFDSLNALEVLVQVSGDLHLDVPETMLQPIAKGGPLTIRVLVERIAALSEETSDVKQSV